MAERVAGMRDRAAAIRTTPTPEAVHQVRVSARRLYAALGVFKPLLLFPGHGRPLRRIERRFGRTRDLDVLCARLTTGSAEDAVVAAAAGGLRSDLESERSDLLEAALGALQDPRYRRLMRRLGTWMARPRYGPPGMLSLEATAPDLLLPELSRLLLHPGWGVEQVPQPDDPTARPLHALRRQVKAFRYQAECFSAWYGDGVVDWLEDLHRLQDALGDWHDEGLLLAALDAAGAPAGLIAAARGRATLAVAGWREWRARHLDPGARAALRGLLETGAPGARRAVGPAAPAGSGSSPRPLP